MKKSSTRGVPDVTMFAVPRIIDFLERTARAGASTTEQLDGKVIDPSA
ncbi:hypothetical protein [Herbiconiux ginsengi]|uniref:Uncharacterized protein n=1 Tax=Herbiconiux ginsengi TaxID=381665 RepID=A0A1H3QNX4_9MICO|nr:hypothetical protein [Herbiconiux ginsengi]SDZ15262.1 hypothetical protein SAMN05216554_2662 [Herbiconiux ginsengi]